MRRGLLLGAIVAGLAATLAFVVPGRGEHRVAAPAAGAAPLSLKEALAVSRSLGPLARSRQLHLVLALRGRNQQELDRLFRSGRSSAGGDFAARYGPDRTLVRAALANLRRAGFHASWVAGDGILSLDGSARLVERFFGVRLTAYLTPGGRNFYASNRQASIPRALRALVTHVGGLDNFGQAQVAAITPGGVAPEDVISFYNIKPLQAAGLDGSGETVVFPELMALEDVAQLRSDLAAYAKTYKLPAFTFTVRSQPSWQPLPKGDPYAEPALEEAALDLEIVHSLAPKAKLIIYLMARDLIVSTKSETAMVRENPTAIISNSTGFCESIIPSNEVLRVIESPWRQQAAQNMTHYVASGDFGAYACREDRPAATDYGASLPVTTGVGGTSVFLAKGGGYNRELAWGNALSASGGGGGISQIYLRPDFQKGIKASGKGRVVPDVAGLADSNTGWHIIAFGKEHQIGGTSAAAPLWAGITALINQSLLKQGLKRVGFATPALYWIGEQNKRFHAFHDVQGGNNRLYAAKAGFDLATGWGSPDAAALAKAWAAYQRK